MASSAISAHGLVSKILYLATNRRMKYLFLLDFREPMGRQETLDPQVIL